ncbi:MFS transporter [Halococcus sediminicola]|uniref:MFS transporter n=1 Tax=Halococcus sediminicola TaxID=1264579 RepID=UPI000679BC4D|nr:MFS transporter [Halococcus sediminicola]
MSTANEYLGINREVLALAIARMADAVGNSFLIVVLPLYIASGTIEGGAGGLGVSLLTGLILSAFGFFNSALQPFAGRLSDKLGKRKSFVLGGLALLAVANFTYSLASSYWMLLAIRAAQGIGASLTIVATIALVNELADDKSRGGNMGTFNTFRLLGFGTGPIVAGSVIGSGPYSLLGFSITGFEAAFYIATVSAVVSFVLVTLLVHDPDIERSVDDEDTSIAVFDHDSEGLLDPVFTLGVASLFMAVGIALLSAIEPQVNARLGQGAQLFGIEFAAFVLMQVLFQAPIGSASDRYGRKPFILVGLALLVPATLAQGLVVAPWEMILARSAQGIAGALVFAPALALAGDLASKGASGTQLSVLTMSFGLGTAIGPLTSGFLVRFGYVTPFAFGAVLAALGFVLVYTQVSETVAVGGDSAGPAASAAQD